MHWCVRLGWTGLLAGLWIVQGPGGDTSALAAAGDPAPTAGSSAGLPTAHICKTPVKAIDLAALLSDQSPGAIVHLAAGTYAGPIVIDRPLTLIGEPGTILQGDGESSVITIAAPDVTLRGLTIRGSGLSLKREDAGVYVLQSGSRALVEENFIENNLFGVFLKGPEEAVLRNNTIQGRQDLHVNERGNGVHMWNSPGSVVTGNDISFGRDGIFTTTSRDNTFSGNHLHDVRFAVHYMYTNESQLHDNISEGNEAGYVMMFSRNITMTGNRSSGDRDHGFLYNYVNGLMVEGNAVTDGGGKCVFIYNANRNVFRQNLFQGCDIGIHFTAGSENNAISDNAFIGNRTQVKYVGTRSLEWAVDGIGNYWSDNPAYDLDGDGIADRSYRPNGLMDQVIWRAPAAKLLMASPAMQILQWAQSAFPAVLPGGVIDPAPLMTPPHVPAATKEAS